MKNSRTAFFVFCIIFNNSFSQDALFQAKKNKTGVLNKIQVSCCIFWLYWTSPIGKGKIPYIHEAIERNSSLAFNKLTQSKRINLNDADHREQTPLYHAVHLSRVNFVQSLLERKADPNIPGKYGETPLAVSIRKSAHAATELLLAYGALPKTNEEQHRYDRLAAQYTAKPPPRIIHYKTHALKPMLDPHIRPQEVAQIVVDYMENLELTIILNTHSEQ